MVSTPSNPDGAEVTMVTNTPVYQDDAFASSGVTSGGEPFSSQGRTTLRTPPGIVFRPSGEYPVITNAGVNVSAEQAETVLAQSGEADGRVFIHIDHETEA